MAKTLARWSSEDEGSAPGGLYNSERPQSPARLLNYPGAVGPVVGAWSVLRDEFRGEQVLEVTTEGLSVGPAQSPRTIRWAEVDRIDSRIAYPRRDHGPLIRVVTCTGETIPIPDRLYPDAATDYPSTRHIARAREVSAALEQALQEHGRSDS